MTALDDTASLTLATAGMSVWRLRGRRFLRYRAATASLVILGLLVVF